MIITFNEAEQGELLKQVHPTKFSTGRVAEILKASYEANFEEDIRSAIEHLTQVSEE